MKKNVIKSIVEINLILAQTKQSTTTKMHESTEEKYLGDYIHKSAKNATKISKRRAKEYGIISDIMYIIYAIPNGKIQTKVGLQLRQSWFLNSLLLNKNIA